MDLKELRKMNMNALEEMILIQKNKIAELRKEFLNKNSGKVRSLRKAKKDLARIFTIINEKKNNG